jgi:hypothetical protein
MPPTDELYPVLKQLRDWLDNDISQLRRRTRTPAPYGAALCIIVGCEALSTLLKGDSPHGIFVRELIQHHRKGFDPHMGKDIWQALRNGLAHVYDTKLIRIGRGGPDLELKVSWEKYRHLEILKGQNPPALVLHIPTMWKDLQRVLRKSLAAVWPGDGRRVSKAWKNSRTWEASDGALKGWSAKLGVPAGPPSGAKPKCRR